MSDRPAAAKGCVNPAQGQDLEAYLEERLTAEREAAFEEHFFACPACIEMLRLRQALPAVLQKLPAPEAIGSHSRRLALYRALAIASTLALVLLAYPAFLGLRRLPDALAQGRTLGGENARLHAEIEQDRMTFERELADLRESSEWTGAVPLLILHSGPRGQSEPQTEATLIIRPGQPFVPLGVMPAAPEQPSAAFRFELLKDDRVVWASELQPSELRQLKQAGVVTFLVPSAVFPTEPAEMTLRQPGATESLLEVRFRVRPAE